MLFDAYGPEGIFVLVALMYVVMAVAVLLGRETFGRSLEANSEFLSPETRKAEG